MRVDLRERLKTGRPLVADGATGTQLQARGLVPGASSELWNEQEPDKVADVARCYAEAGSDLVYTNSFGGNPWQLGHYGATDRLESLNTLAAQLARRGAGESVYVVGSMGPSGEFLEPLGDLTEGEVEDAYARQAAALVAGGVDALVLETFAALEELCAAVRGARSAAGGKPIIASLTYGAGVRTMMGVAPAAARDALGEAGADVLGLNCGDDIEIVLPVLGAYADGTLPLLAKPNTGMPVIQNGQPVWPIGPDDFAQRAAGWLAGGARIIGGCCGSTPAHIGALARLVRQSEYAG